MIPARLFPRGVGWRFWKPTFVFFFTNLRCISDHKCRFFSLSSLLYSSSPYLKNSPLGAIRQAVATKGSAQQCAWNLALTATATWPIHQPWLCPHCVRGHLSSCLGHIRPRPLTWRQTSQALTRERTISSLLLSLPEAVLADPILSLLARNISAHLLTVGLQYFAVPSLFICK